MNTSAERVGPGITINNTSNKFKYKTDTSPDQPLVSNNSIIPCHATRLLFTFCIFENNPNEQFLACLVVKYECQLPVSWLFPARCPPPSLDAGTVTVPSPFAVTSCPLTTAILGDTTVMHSLYFTLGNQSNLVFPAHLKISLQSRLNCVRTDKIQLLLSSCSGSCVLTGRHPLRCHRPEQAGPRRARKRP